MGMGNSNFKGDTLSEDWKAFKMADFQNGRAARSRGVQLRITGDIHVPLIWVVYEGIFPNLDSEKIKIPLT